MTEKYYYEKPYLKELEATVTSICKKGLILDRTISYPEGGGQPGDRGFINGIPYSDTIHDGDDIIHIMSDSSSFNVGDKVTIHLDWDMTICSNILLSIYFLVFCLITIKLVQYLFIKERIF